MKKGKYIINHYMKQKHGNHDAYNLDLKWFKNTMYFNC